MTDYDSPWKEALYVYNYRLFDRYNRE